MSSELFRPDIRIDQLTIEQPSTTFEFNFVPEQYLQPDDWDYFNQERIGKIARGKYALAACLTRNLLILYPEKKELLEIDEAGWSHLRDDVRRNIDHYLSNTDENDARHPARDLENIKWLYPGRIHEIAIPNELEEELNSSLKFETGEEGMQDFYIWDARLYKTLYPGQFTESNFDSENIHYVLDHLGELRQNIASALETWAAYADLLVDLKIVDPQSMDKVMIDEEVVNGMIGLLDDFRQGKYFSKTRIDIAAYAADLRLLSMGDIVVGEEHIEVHPRPAKVLESDSLVPPPEVRKF
jgi:hypothetical protein